MAKPLSFPETVCGKCGLRMDNIICSGSPEVLRIIEKSKVICRFRPGQYIFYAGNEPLGIYSITKGLAKLEVDSPSGTAHTLRLVGPAGVLGYRSLFANETYQASAVAVEETEICFLPKADVMTIFKGNPEIAMRLLEHLSKDLRLAEEKWIGQMDKEASERIAEALLFLQENFVTQVWTRREIAQWAGTTPETVMRTLSQFEREGLIDQSKGRTIQILNVTQLKERSHSHK